MAADTFQQYQAAGFQHPAITPPDSQGQSNININCMLSVPAVCLAVSEVRHILPF